MGKYIPVKNIIPPKRRKPTDKNQKLSLKKKLRKITKTLSKIDEKYKVIKPERTYIISKSPKPKSKTETSGTLTYHLNNYELLQAEANKIYEDYSKKDLHSQTIDEIALEGLDGITIEALWKRLMVSFDNTIFTKSLQNDIWATICVNSNLMFYELPEPRPELVICDKFQYDFDSTQCVEVTGDQNDDIYPYGLVTNEAVRGSCKTFSQRVNITNTVRGLTLEQAVKTYGNKLVIVADQKTRENSIIDEGANPQSELLDVEYAILERIGRSRYAGECTRGNNSLVTIISDPKTLFHYQKNLFYNNMICKQNFTFKNLDSEQLKNGRLLQLMRFYNLRKTKRVQIMEELFRLLKSKPNGKIEYSEVRSVFPKQMMPSVIRVIKSEAFREHVKTDQLAKYREMHPQASVREWRCMAKNKEKCVRVLELKDPRRNILATWNNSDDSDDETQVEEYTIGHKVFNSDTTFEVYKFCLSKGKDGVLLNDIISSLEMDIYSVRLILKKLMHLDLIVTEKHDSGKQRYLKYVGKCFSNDKVTVNLEPSPLPPRKASVLDKLKAKQALALQKASKDQIYTLEQRELDRLKIEDDFKTIKDLPAGIQIRRLVPFRQDLERQPPGTYVAHFVNEGKTFTIRLSFKQYVSVLKPKLNDILQEQPIEPFELVKAANILHEYVELRHKDLATKMLLLKLMMNELNSNKSEFYLKCIEESLKSKKNLNEIIVEMARKDVSVEPKKLTATPQLKPPSIPKTAFNYMGPNPVIITDDVNADGVRILLELSTPPAEYRLENSVYVPCETFTSRSLSRLNLVLSHVKKERIMEDAPKMGKIIEKTEAEEGYDKKIDKKSVYRIFKRLIEEGYIKIFKLTMSNDRVLKWQTFLCDLDVESDHPVIKSCIDQFTLKFFMGTSNRKRPADESWVKPSPAKKPALSASAFSSEDVKASIQQFNSASEKNVLPPNTYKHDTRVGQIYGYRPKFIRLQILHEFLHYLLCFSKAKERLSQERVKELFKRHKIELTDQELVDMPPMYVDEISWMSFVHPLPKHKGWGERWTLIADVVLRLPLSLFVKIHNVSYHDQQLVELLQHPVKRHFLITSLPDHIKSLLFHKRKYLYGIYNIICNLAFIGLVQFGPQKQKEKDQVFVYLNKNASILDTTSSDLGYNMISDKEYPKLRFTFDTMEDLHQYWFELWRICMNTKLGSRNIVSGKEVVYLDISAKPELLKSNKPQTNETAPLLDKGEVPGDGKGAGGLDSVMWPHIARNWFWMSRTKKADAGSELTLLKRERYDHVQTKVVQFSQMRSATFIEARQRRKKIPPNVTMHQVTVSKTSKKRPKIVKKFDVVPKKPKSRGNDLLDTMLLKTLGSTRVQWDECEDKFLYINKAVLLLLCPKYPKRNYIPFTVQRDVLHLCIPRSRNKCSAAVRRRMYILFKDDAAFRSIENSYRNLLRIKAVERYFKHPIYDIAQHGLANIKEKQVRILYMFLMAYLTRHLDDVRDLLLGTTTNFEYYTISGLEENEDNFVYCDEPGPGYSDALTEDDVIKDVAKSIIHSNLGCQGNHPAWMYQLFRTYQKYPEHILHLAVEELKLQQLVTLKPTSLTKSKKKNWDSPFRLSSYYIFMQACTFSTTAVLEAAKTYVNAVERRQHPDFSVASLEVKKYGQMLGYNEMFTFWDKFDLEFYMPEYSQILDPSIQDHSVIEELAKRHQIKIKRTIQESQKEQEKQKQVGKEPTQEEEKPDADEEKDNTQAKADQVNPDDSRAESPVDLGVETQDDESETIDKLRSWVTDCMSADLERRSPSPEFFEKDDGEEFSVRMATPEVPQVSHREDERQLVPTLDEIKTAMMDNDTSTQNRRIPHISSLLNNDEETQDKLKSHFINQYPQILDIVIDDLDEFRDCPEVDQYFNKDNLRSIWKQLQKDITISEPVEHWSHIIHEFDIESEDLLIMEDIVEFVNSVGVCGASSSDLRNRFPNTPNKPLEVLIQILVKKNVLLQKGICTLRFVHYEFREHWVIDTFKLTTEDQKLIEDNKDCLTEAKDTLESQLNPVDKKKVQIMPWVKVDGSFNTVIFRQWLSCVMSHVLDNPRTHLTNLFDKYCYVKPVDLYYLLGILQQLKCVELYVYETPEFDLFSDIPVVTYRKATILDNFEDIFLVGNTVSMITLGLFYEQLDDVSDFISLS